MRTRRKSSIIYPLDFSITASSAMSSSAPSCEAIQIVEPMTAPATSVRAVEFTRSSTRFLSIECKKSCVRCLVKRVCNCWCAAFRKCRSGSNKMRHVDFSVDNGRELNTRLPFLPIGSSEVHRRRQGFRRLQCDYPLRSRTADKDYGCSCQVACEIGET